MWYSICDMGSQDGGGGGGVPKGERRYVTLLFSDICNYTQLTETYDADDVSMLRDRVELLATQIFEKHGGTISQMYGDGILGVFGMPHAGEREVLAAIDTALALRDAVAGLSGFEDFPGLSSLHMHSGIHCGVCSIKSGNALHGRYRLDGEPVTTASRLCSAAGEDEVVISSSSLSGMEPLYELKVLEPLRLKNKAHLMPAVQVLGRSGDHHNTRFDASRLRGFTEFVCRKEELAQLRAAASRCEPGQAQIVTVIGGAGVGKSRLLEEFMKSARDQGQIVFRGHCEESGRPFQPFVHMLEQAFKLSPGANAKTVEDAVRQGCAELELSQAHVDEFLRLLSVNNRQGRGESKPSGPDPRLRTLADAVAGLLGALSTGPVLLAVDDCQWSDDASLDVLDELVELVAERGVLALLASRDAETRQGLRRIIPTEKLELSPLGSEESTKMIRKLVQDAVEPSMVHELYKCSGGNPLFLEELCRALPDNALGEWAEHHKWQVPSSVFGVIQARLNRLPEREARVLRAASVVGIDFSTSVLAQVVDAGVDIAAALNHLTEADFIRPHGVGGDNFKFKHGIAQEAVYSTVRQHDRLRIHALIALVLASRAAQAGYPEPHATLAKHYRLSRNNFLAAHHAHMAGDHAMRNASLDTARRLFQTALNELDLVQSDRSVKRQWLAISSSWARAWVYRPAPEHLEILNRAVQLAEELGDEERGADAELMSAWVCYALGYHADAITHAKRGQALAHKLGHDGMVGQLGLNLGQSLAASGAYEEASELLQRGCQAAFAWAQETGRSVSEGVAYGQAVLGAIAGEQGRFEEAEHYISRARELVHGRNTPIQGSIMGVGVMIQLWRGDLDRCLAEASCALRYAESIHGPYLYSIETCMSVFARVLQRPQESLLRQLISAVESLEARGMRLYFSMTLGAVAEASMVAGDRDSALIYARRAVARARSQDPFGVVPGQLVLASLALAQGNLQDARSALDTAQGWAIAHKSRRSAALVALGESELGCFGYLARDKAQERAGFARDEFAAMGMSYYFEQAEKRLDALLTA